MPDKHRSQKPRTKHPEGNARSRGALTSEHCRYSSRPTIDLRPQRPCLRLASPDLSVEITLILGGLPLVGCLDRGAVKSSHLLRVCGSFCTSEPWQIMRNEALVTKNMFSTNQTRF